MEQWTKHAGILIVDDQESNLLLLGAILDQAGMTNHRAVRDPRDVLSTFRRFRPDLVLLDLMMPHLDGYEVLRQIQSHVAAGEYLPVLVLTADMTDGTRKRALSMGAKDFLTKPFDPIEVTLRIKNLLETRLLHRTLRDQNQILEKRVRVRTEELDEARLEILERLALAAEYRDDATHEHIVRVGWMAAELADRMNLSRDEVETIGLAAPLHDLGKIGIPDDILLKPGKLTEEEFEKIKTHTTIGAQILSGSKFPLLRKAEEIALTHHERWDGSGYTGLEQETIPLAGRIVAVVDVFDALVHERPYKKAWSVEEAITEIRRSCGTHFDPSVVRAFLSLARDGGIREHSQAG